MRFDPREVIRIINSSLNLSVSSKVKGSTIRWFVYSAMFGRRRSQPAFAFSRFRAGIIFRRALSCAVGRSVGRFLSAGFTHRRLRLRPRLHVYPRPTRDKIHRLQSVPIQAVSSGEFFTKLRDIKTRVDKYKIEKNEVCEMVLRERTRLKIIKIYQNCFH